MTKARRGIKQVLSYGDDLRRNPFAERKAALHKVLRRTVAGFNMSNTPKATGGNIQSRLQAWLGVSKKLDPPYRSGAVEDLDESQKSEGTGSNSRRRWDLLMFLCRVQY